MNYKTKQNIIEKAKELVEPYGKLVFLTVFGSHLYGTNTLTSDTDYKGIFIPHKQDLLKNIASHHISYSTGKSDSKNTKDDIDFVINTGEILH